MTNKNGLVTDEGEEDDVQYIKEEQAPPITIEEGDDQEAEADDIIFVSTCPPPTPALPPSWHESLGKLWRCEFYYTYTVKIHGFNGTIGSKHSKTESLTKL